MFMYIQQKGTSTSRFFNLTVYSPSFAMAINNTWILCTLLHSKNSHMLQLTRIWRIKRTIWRIVRKTSIVASQMIFLPSVLSVWHIETINMIDFSCQNKCNEWKISCLAKKISYETQILVNSNHNKTWLS